MYRATISQLKNRLSAYLDKVRAGATVLVLDRDQPIARIERVGRGGADGDRLARLERAGVVRRGRRRLALDEIRAAPLVEGRGLLDALLAERREGR